MGYVLLALLGILLLLLLIAVIRTLCIKGAPAAAFTPACTESEARVCAEKLAAMVQIPSVSRREDEDLSEFFRLHEVLA